MQADTTEQPQLQLGIERVQACTR